jgi:PLP dependent protein
MTSPASFANEELAARVQQNLAVLRERIVLAGRDLATVRIVAVTKTFGPEAVLAAYHAGLTHVGENYVDELCTKRESLADLPMRWHYLGALQSNKIAKVARCADVVCGISRVKEVDVLARVRPMATCYVQVDATGAAQRNGASFVEARALVAHARDRGLNVSGLMMVAPPEPALADRAFADTRDLADELGLAERSMGMSEDLELALAHGSTEIRVGRGLFGPRETPGRSALT